ncbi:aminoglycoside 6-adenylyltransferase [Clostridium oryzae]|uniref:Aminoglycoside 6-adenylyltransferase n=1 Tax=Clostridium oryzae TaxID=1450648 RepID=A0A1V4IFL8_9CLOT|nr:aminoglycoside 6-adenylyltransferase [Clostridium oryzae]OPJ58455.1 aminoglycoside 6-adenylyltransferase [Clostridium oryzae]
MRTEQEMFDLILNTARNDTRIRAVIMNGSRANPNVPKDIFQDYDIVYLVTETESFIKDKDWIKVFGEPVIFQFPDEMDKNLGYETHFERCYGYLMQFDDGNRIDLHVETLDLVLEEVKSDKLTVVLMDKDNKLPKIAPPTDEDYWVKKPDKALYSCCCNEYWWTMLYIAKGLWRDEILFSLDFLNNWVRPQLFKMISWYAGILTNFSCSVGKCGKYLDKYLAKAIWKRYLKTYPAAEKEAVWNSIFIMNELFEEIALKVAEEFDFCYEYADAKRSREFAEHIRQLPKDAKEIL